MPPASQSNSVQIGDVLADKYRVEKVLGAGGMGVVVAAVHLELHEKVAIKFLLDDADLESEQAERFLREARAAVKIRSEHVARVVDVGRLPSRAPYMVMEYLEGSDLSDYLQKKRLSVPEAVDYVIQACEAMSVAHREGIIHRDLKPANLFRAKRPDGSVVIKVLDFGISKMRLPDASQAALTQTSSMMGSPLYMSPEQMRSTKNADARCDIWSLGAILYELLTGRPPFDSDSLGDLFAKVMLENHQPAHLVRPEVAKELSAVVDRCLQKDPAQRFFCTEQLAVALGPFAPERSQGLVRRLNNTLRGAGNGPTDPPPVNESLDLGATEVELQQVQLPGVLTEAEGSAPQSPEAAATRTSWEHTRGGAPQKPRHPWLAAALVVPLAGALAAWMLWSKGEAVTATPQSTQAAVKAEFVPASPARATASPETLKPPAAQPEVAIESPEPVIAEPEPRTPSPRATPAVGTTATGIAKPKPKAEPKPKAPKPKAEPEPEAKASSRAEPKAPPSTNAPKPDTSKNPLSIEFK